MKILDEEAVAIIAENKELENKILELLGDLPLERCGMILSSLLVRVAIMKGMPKAELLYIIRELYDIGACGTN